MVKYSFIFKNILDPLKIFSIDREYFLKYSSILHLIIFKHHFSLFCKNIPDILLYARMLLSEV